MLGEDPEEILCTPFGLEDRRTHWVQAPKDTWREQELLRVCITWVITQIGVENGLGDIEKKGSKGTDS